MFTGIVAEVGTLSSRQPEGITIQAGPILKGIELGNSVAVNGACLTVTHFTHNTFSVDLSPETLKRTNLGSVKNGDFLNLERPLGLGGELGGHLVQGHVDSVGRIINISPAGSTSIFSFAAPDDITRYLVEKGFIAVEGISLTITARSSTGFEVSIIDFTLTHTNMRYHKIGDPVNLEVDIMAKYAEQFIKVQRSNLTVDFLKDNGF